MGGSLEAIPSGAGVGCGAGAPCRGVTSVSSLLPSEIQGSFPSGFAVETESRVPILPADWWVALSKTLALSGPWPPRLCREGENPYLLPSSFSLLQSPFPMSETTNKRVEGSTQPRERVPGPRGRGTENAPDGRWEAGPAATQGNVSLFCWQSRWPQSVTHTCTDVHTYVHTHAQVCTCVCVHTHSHKHVHTAERIYHTTGYWLFLGSLIKVNLIVFPFFTFSKICTMN